MSSVTKPVGGGTFTYTLSTVPDAAPVMRIFDDPERTNLVEGPTTLVVTGNPSAFDAPYSDALPAGQYFLGFIFEVGGEPRADNDDTLLLVFATGVVSGNGAGPCEPWAIDDECCTFPDDATDALIERQRAVSTELLWAASGRVWGPCEITVRPCLRRCADAFGFGARASFAPLLIGGRWTNVSTCGCSAECACSQLCEVALEGPVSGIVEVLVDGLAVTDWRLDFVGERAYLVRTSSECWPACQDLATPPDEEGAFAVTYLRGLELTTAAIAAHTELTCELVKACVPNCECRLPRNVQSKTRQGITIAFDTSQTWIYALPTVASWLNAVNPGKLPRPMRVMSPDARPMRRHA